MAYLKRYKMRINEAIIKLTYAGVDVTCHFENGNMRLNQCATMQTSNEIVQRAIEHSDLYGRHILPDGDPIPLEQAKKAFSPESIVNIQQLRDYLVEECGCDRQKVSSPNAMKAKVKELGLELPNMKW